MLNRYQKEMMNNKQNILNINKHINISNNSFMFNYVANIGMDVLWGKTNAFITREHVCTVGNIIT